MGREYVKSSLIETFLLTDRVEFLQPGNKKVIDVTKIKNRIEFEDFRFL